MGGTKLQSRGRIAGIAALGMAMSLGALAGCRVAETDVHRWEGTEHGPQKLVAVITHDKYAIELRTEAAMSLVRMPARGGTRQGIGFLVDKYKDEEGNQKEGALNQLAPEVRQQIVDRVAPLLIKELDAPPPARTAEGRLPPDPTIPFKDATFAMLIHDPPIVTNEETRTALKNALTKWSQTGFEDRVENGSQQFGLEQMMRYLGVDSVKTLPGLVNENTARLDRIASLVYDVGDEPTKLKLSEALVNLANKYHSKDWLDAQTKIVKDSNTKNNIKADDTQVAGQVDKIQERRLTEEVFPAMKKVGGRPAVDYLFTYAANGQNSADRRKLALAALEGRVDKNNAQDLERLFAIAKNDDNPDTVRDGAFARMGELPKEQIIPKLYTLGDAKKWKVRYTAFDIILKTMTTRQVPEFMGHLPKTNATKSGMTEPLLYGADIRKMEPGPGDPKPRDVINGYLNSKDFGPHMAALGFFWEGKKDDKGAVAPFENESTALPKCEQADECSWSCDVPKKDNPKETEPKELKTVGDFVHFCLLPSMEH